MLSNISQCSQANLQSLNLVICKNLHLNILYLVKNSAQNWVIKFLFCCIVTKNYFFVNTLTRFNKSIIPTRAKVKKKSYFIALWLANKHARPPAIIATDVKIQTVFFWENPACNNLWWICSASATNGDWPLQLS